MVVGAPAETLVTKELEKYVDAAEDNFKIDFNYSLGQRVMELSDSNKESAFSTHRSKVMWEGTRVWYGRMVGRIVLR